MSIKSLFRLVLVLVALVLAAIALDGLIDILGNSALFWPSPWSDISSLLASLLKLSLMVALFFAIPGVLIVFALKLEDWLSYFLAGALCGVLLLFTSYLDYRLMPTGIGSARILPKTVVLALTTHLPALMDDFVATVQWTTLCLTSAVCGSFAAFGWRNRLRNRQLNILRRRNQVSPDGTLP